MNTYNVTLFSLLSHHVTNLAQINELTNNGTRYKDISRVLLIILIQNCIVIVVCVLVGHCLVTKVFIGKLPATRELWVIMG